MSVLFAQGDLLIESVAEANVSGSLVSPEADGATVLAEGEATGHRHAIFDNVTMFRDDSLARDIPSGLYLGHVVVADANAKVVHQEHAPVSLTPGTYRLRRQRQVEPLDVQPVAD